MSQRPPGDPKLSLPRDRRSWLIALEGSADSRSYWHQLLGRLMAVVDSPRRLELLARTMRHQTEHIKSLQKWAVNSALWTICSTVNEIRSLSVERFLGGLGVSDKSAILFGPWSNVQFLWLLASNHAIPQNILSHISHGHVHVYLYSIIIGIAYLYALVIYHNACQQITQVWKVVSLSLSLSLLSLRTQYIICTHVYIYTRIYTHIYTHIM